MIYDNDISREHNYISSSMLGCTETKQYMLGVHCIIIGVWGHFLSPHFNMVLLLSGQLFVDGDILNDFILENFIRQ